jgi:hypothetical protein
MLTRAIQRIASGDWGSEEGNDRNEVDLIEAGLISAVLGQPATELPMPLAAFSPSVCFGESTFLSGAPRTAENHARLEPEQPLIGA